MNQEVKKINGYAIKDEKARQGIDLISNNIKKINILDNLNLKKYSELIDDYSDEYNGNIHNYLQGFCKVNNNIVMGFYDVSHNDNYVKLIEYNPETNTIVRSTYLTLYHCNSISYNEREDKLYIATATSANNGSTTTYNAIITVDYETFEIIDTITLTNLPNDKNIRSVYYDNENNQLYSFDKYTVFVINESTNSITNTIGLDVITDDGTNANQTIKKYNNMFVGLYYGFIAFWDLEGNLIKVIDLVQYQSGEKLGEPEDFYIEENGNIVIGFTKKLANDRKERITTFYISNKSINTTSSFVPNIVKNDDESIIIQVDNTSNEELENGTSNFPYKDLQKAVNIARNISDYVTIYVRGNNYQYTDITGCNNLSLRIKSNITIDGLKVDMSNVDIVPDSGVTLTLNGLACIFSKLKLRATSSNHAIINVFNNTNLITGALSNYINKCIQCVFSEINLLYCDITGNDNNDCCVITQGSNASFELCTFDDYSGHYAINISNTSNVKLNRNTFSIAISDTQGRFRVANGSVLNSQNNQNDKRMYTSSYLGKIYGVSIKDNSVSDTFYGDVCNIDTEYNMMRLKVKIGGYTDKYKYVDIPTNFDKTSIETLYINDTAQNTNLMTIENVSGKLSITEHRRLYLNTSNYNYETITQTPSNTTIYSCISAVEFYNI